MNGIINNRNAAFGAAAFVLAVLAGASSFADDIVGVMSVDVGTNGLAEVEMPFSPMCPDQGPIGYVSGTFFGDGGELSVRPSSLVRSTVRTAGA